ncbi:glycosyltransferase [Seongchinamella sediminis]|uniref:Glycosyltransferase n=2 Tax=Seongchinamella sediminis TaxID=2283635 RepID=A0A3L7DTS2_9GAMM|nr:glycosyltransferase family A protein [Seongchinamella sediminis]RLQ20784.1 glycosyltransferase [Seongchinamella sediminis]
MPCYNSAETIRDSIASVQDQTMESWELIIVDDGSRDGTADVVMSERYTRTRVFKQNNEGSASARNRGLLEAQGQFIAFLDADDAWEPTFLERMHDALASDEGAVLAYCGWQNLGLKGGRGKPFIPPDYEPLDRAETFLGGCRWPIHGALVRKTAIDQSGGFDPKLQASVDYDLWLRVVTQGRLVLVPEVLAYYVHHEGIQITKNRSKVALNHLRAQEKFIACNPYVVQALGKRRVRELTEGELLNRAYICYWDRDLLSARTLFRHVMRRRYGRPKDWLYMLPSLLPYKVHAMLLDGRDGE